MRFVIYETVNKLNQKRYRGAHVCKSLDDNYLGSGKLLKKAIAKYGFENFERKILKECRDIEEMFEQEAIFVNKAWIEDPNTYNLKIGGEGGWDYINKEGLRWTEEKKLLHSIEMKKKRTSDWKPKKPTYGFRGKTHSETSKQSISKNNGMILDEQTIVERIKQWNSIPNKWGKISQASKLWNVSHTQVRRFVKKHNLRVA